MATQRTQHLKVAGTPQSPTARGGDDYNRQLEQAEDQLEKLRLQREEIERKRLEAEEISNQRQQFIDGQIELLEKLDQSVQAVDREIFESRQELKELEEARKTFASHLQTLQAVDPRKWKKTKMGEEVDQALDLLENCENDYEDIAANLGENRRRGFLATKKANTQDTFAQTFKQGFAFNLPIIILGTVALLMLLNR